jgi:hypothetical protein
MSYGFTQYSLCQGLTKFQSQTKVAAMAEMKQLHEMHAFQPINKSDLSNQHLLYMLSLLMLIKQKRCGHFEARECANGRPQRLLNEEIDVSSPIVKTKSLILTSETDAEE